MHVHVCMHDYVKIRKVGDSIVITVPRHLVEQLNWEVGEKVLVTASQDGVLTAEKEVE